MTRILVSQNDFVQRTIEAASSGAVLKWIIPKTATVGDDALIFARSTGFFARATVLSPPVPADDLDWPGRYAGDVGEISVLDMFVPLDCIRSEMPKFSWARYPRSFTTPDRDTAAHLARVIADYQHDNLDLVPDSLVVASEGARRLVYLNSYERSRLAREECKRIHGTTCVGCGFDFGIEYGSSFVGYIHVHHLRPLAEINEEYVVDPKADLVPVCPNCHAVIHSRNPPYSIDELRALVIQCSGRVRPPS